MTFDEYLGGLTQELSGYQGTLATYLKSQGYSDAEANYMASKYNNGWTRYDPIAGYQNYVDVGDKLGIKKGDYNNLISDFDRLKATYGSEYKNQENSMDAYSKDLDAAARVADQQQKQAEGAEDAQKQALETARNAAAAGINKSRAGMLGDTSTNAQNMNSNGYIANQQQRGSTQNDYLQKMAQADALDNQVRNMKTGAALNTISSGIQGAAAGMSLGMASDESLKESPIDDDKLNEAINQFKTLYRQVRSMRKCGKR